MRISRVLILLFAVGAGACRTGPGDLSPDPDIDGDTRLRIAARVLAETGSPLAEEVLAAAGSTAAPHIRPLLESGNPELRRRAALLLLSAGEDIPLTAEERVDLILFDLMRPEAQPYAGVAALGRLHELGSAAVPALTRVGTEEGERGRMARSLLGLLGEAR